MAPESGPLRVLFDHRIFVEQAHGGVSRYFAGIAEHLSDAGVEPRIFAPLHINSYLGNLPQALVWGRRMAPRGITMAIGRRLGAALAPLAARIHGADVVHETYYGESRSGPRGMPTVITVYDMIHELYPGMAGADRLIEWKRAAVRRADWIACISENTRRDLLEYYPEVADRSSVTLLGFEPVTPLSASAPPSGRPYILYVGARPGYKNFAGLLEAFAMSAILRKDFDLICVGAGGFSQSEIEAIKAAGLESQTQQLHADDQALNALYRGAAVFVYPSLYEGFGIPPLEAMAADCPVVAVRSSSIPEVCGDAVEYSVPGDIGSLMSAIEKVVTSPSRAAQLRAAGRARIRRFSWQRCAAETAAIYRSLA